LDLDDVGVAGRGVVVAGGLGDGVVDDQHRLADPHEGAVRVADDELGDVQLGGRVQPRALQQRRDLVDDVGDGLAPVVPEGGGEAAGLDAEHRGEVRGGLAVGQAVGPDTGHAHVAERHVEAAVGGRGADVEHDAGLGDVHLGVAAGGRLGDLRDVGRGDVAGGGGVAGG